MTILTVNPHTLFLCMFLRMSWVAQIAGVGGYQGCLVLPLHVDWTEVFLVLRACEGFPVYEGPGPLVEAGANLI